VINNNNPVHAEKRTDTSGFSHWIQPLDSGIVQLHPASKSAGSFGIEPTVTELIYLIIEFSYQSELCLLHLYHDG